MMGMAGPQVPQDLCGFELARMALVGEVDRLEDGERVEGARFGIVRIGASEPLHRSFVRLRARRMAPTAIVAVVDVERVDERALARGLRLRGLGPAQERGTLPQRIRF